MAHGNRTPSDDGPTPDDGGPAAVDRVSDDGSVGELFDALRNPRRRFVLWYLETHRPVVPAERLARCLAAWEGSDRDEVHCSLRHVHLPMLADADLVSYDADRGTVERRGPTDDALEVAAGYIKTLRGQTPTAE